MRVSSLTATEYQTMALRTLNPNLSNMEQLEDGIMGLCGEAGECLDILKKHKFQGHELDKEHLIKELGDVSWYLAVTANALGVGLDSIFKTNINKLQERYPDGFITDKSVNRREGDI